jgi:O-acetylserine/cysteine efflux transporter
MSEARSPSASHLLLALVVVAIWGTNFVVIRIGLRDFPPFLFACLRFLFSAIPLLFFMRRPAVGWSALILFGLFLGVGQFGLLFYAMRSDITPGLASLVIQCQVFFTIGLSMWVFRERVRRASIAGMALAASGLVLIAANLDASATPVGMACVLAAGLCWACANTVVKKAARAQRVDMLAFVVWASIFAVLPLALLSAIFEGGLANMTHALAHAGWEAWVAVAWQVIGNTLFAFAAWNWLQARYDAAVISPYALLIPVFGIASSALFLGEALPGWKIAAAGLVIAGIALASLASRMR